jgi:wyosine [tRNA(Phe)-imidazoG37] synthetase (radical SAM superfamily)
LSIIYGPVPSWRLGKSLGIDILSTPGKTCSFDCVYCQLGKTIHPCLDRKEFVPITTLIAELEMVKNVPADYATFSGVGEPTLALNLGEAIRAVKSILCLPVAVLTNSSLLPREEVRLDISKADVVVAKLDAPNEELFQAINRPVNGQSLDEIVRGIKLLYSEFTGKVSLQMMFIEANKKAASEMAKIAGQLSADEVQINTPLRKCAVRPLPPADIIPIRQTFSDFKNVVTVYEVSRPIVKPMDSEETLRRRP